MLRKTNLEFCILQNYLSKEREIKTFSDERTRERKREFVASGLAVQGRLKEVLQRRKKYIGQNSYLHKIRKSSKEGISESKCKTFNILN